MSNEEKQIDIVCKSIANKSSPVENSTLYNTAYRFAKKGIEAWLEYQELRRQMLETPAPEQKVFIPKMPNI